MPRIQFLIHGGRESPEAVRATEFSRCLRNEDVHFSFREGPRADCARRWNRERKSFRPDITYVLNTGMPGAFLAVLWKALHGVPFILDTGDAVFELAKSAGLAPRWKLPLIKAWESAAQRAARRIVVRGTRHREFLAAEGRTHVSVIRDGYREPGRDASPEAEERLRAQFGLGREFVVGLMGSLVHSPRLNICYGWDLVDALALLRDMPVRGLVIGDGPGRHWLENRARAKGVFERMVFCGRIKYSNVPAYLRLLDAAISTQTNNRAGQVRTTGKLPEYMAAGRFILASRVGEAALVLPENMLLEYRGEVDLDYPRRLAERIRELAKNPVLLASAGALPGLAKKCFSYEILREEFKAAVQAAWQGG